MIWGPTAKGKVIWLCIEFLLPTAKLRYQDGFHGKFSTRGMAGKNNLNEEIIPLLPTGKASDLAKS